MPLTPELVRTFWLAHTTQFKASVKKKDQSTLMQDVAKVLGELKIQDPWVFLKDFVTTLSFGPLGGNTIYVPFEIGDESTGWTLWNQIRVCTHECQHLVQAEREGWAEFDVKYVTSSSCRAGYEAEAFGSEIELEHWRSDKFDIDQFVQYRPNVLQLYSCSDADIQTAREILTARAMVTKQGAVECKSALIAIGWLNTYVPDLQEW